MITINASISAFELICLILSACGVILAIYGTYKTDKKEKHEE